MKEAENLFCPNKPKTKVTKYSKLQFQTHETAIKTTVKTTLSKNKGKGYLPKCPF